MAEFSAAAEFPLLYSKQYWRSLRAPFAAGGVLVAFCVAAEFIFCWNGSLLAISDAGPYIMPHSKMTRVLGERVRQEYRHSFAMSAALIASVHAWVLGLILLLVLGRIALRVAVRGHGRAPSPRRAAVSGSGPSGAASDDGDACSPLPAAGGAFSRGSRRPFDTAASFEALDAAMAPQLRSIGWYSVLTCGLLISVYLGLGVIQSSTSDAMLIVHTVSPSWCFGDDQPAPDQAGYPAECSDPAIRHALGTAFVAETLSTGLTLALLTGCCNRAALPAPRPAHVLALCLVSISRYVLPLSLVKHWAVVTIGLSALAASAAFLAAAVRHAERGRMPAAAGHRLSHRAAAAMGLAQQQAHFSTARRAAVLEARRLCARTLAIVALVQLVALLARGVSANLFRRDLWPYGPSWVASVHLVTSLVAVSYLTLFHWFSLRLHARALQGTLARIARDEEELRRIHDHRMVLLYLCHETRMPMGTLAIALEDVRSRVGAATAAVAAEVARAKARGRRRARHVTHFADGVYAALVRTVVLASAVGAAGASVRRALVSALEDPRGAALRHRTGLGESPASASPTPPAALDRQRCHRPPPSDDRPLRNRIALGALSRLLERTSQRLADGHGVPLRFELRGAIAAGQGATLGAAPTAFAYGPQAPLSADSAVLGDEARLLQLFGVLIFNGVRHAGGTGASVSLGASELSPPTEGARWAGATAPGPPSLLGARHGGAAGGPPRDVELTCIVEDGGRGLSAAVKGGLAGVGVRVRGWAGQEADRDRRSGASSLADLLLESDSDAGSSGHRRRSSAAESGTGTESSLSAWNGARHTDAAVDGSTDESAASAGSDPGLRGSPRESCFSSIGAAVQIAAAHRGWVGCASEGEGRGAVFWAVLTLRRAEQAPGPGQPWQPHLQGGSAAGLRWDERGPPPAASPAHARFETAGFARPQPAVHGRHFGEGNASLQVPH